MLTKPLRRRRHVRLQINRLPRGATVDAAEPANAGKLGLRKVPVVRSADQGIFDRTSKGRRIVIDGVLAGIAVRVRIESAPRFTAEVEESQSRHATRVPY